MADGRRHSVDLPISRTLIALRRVRSLRDPSTNSMSKFANLLENVNWETDSNNEVSLRFMNGGGGGSFERNGLNGVVNDVFNGRDKERLDDLHCDLGIVELVNCEAVGGDENNEQEVFRGNGAVGAGHCGSYRSNGLELVCSAPLSSQMEDADSSNETTVGSPEVDSFEHNVVRQNPCYRSRIRSPGKICDCLSDVDSRSVSMSDHLSSHSASLFANEDTDFPFQNESGCGISCCWTKSPRFRESNLSRPLLTGVGSDTASYGQSGWNHLHGDIPRSLSQKFKPKSFDELVGHHVVAKSLLGAISRRRVASLYLFHGPRGTGKTSASRLFAAALNCLSAEENKPCGGCRECVSFFSGRCKDVKEMDSVRINRTERIRSLMKNAQLPPSSSKFRVFIFDECHMLRAGTWAMFLNNLENLSTHVVFIMITPDLDKLPRSVVTRSQRYHFPKVNDADVASRLAKICVDEGLSFDQVAIDFIAAKSNGSLRDAEMMLDQLSLLGKRITLSLAYELVGVVSDDELLNLLDLALSSDTSNTVIRARELMRSRIDSMQLVSQLANLIMDILSRKCPEDCSEIRRKFSRKYASEANIQRLSYALKILSETEKQLRVSKNQSTWLTVALLQLSSMESFSDGNDRYRDGDFCSSSSTGESLKHLVPCSCDDNKAHKLGNQGICITTMDMIWKKATDLCCSDSLKNFLRKQGKLASLCVNEGLALVELEFHHPDYVAKAEKCWKLIASSLQSVLGCNVEIRINLVLSGRLSKFSRLRLLSFRLFNCSRRIKRKSGAPVECGSDSDCSYQISEQPMMRENATTCSADFESQRPSNSSQRIDRVRALRSSDGNVLSIGGNSFHGSLIDGKPKCPGIAANLSRDVKSNPEDKVNCFPSNVKFQEKSFSSDTDQQDRELASNAYIGNHNTYVLHSNSNTNNSRVEDGLEDDSRALCWRTPTLSATEVCQLTHQRKQPSLVRRVLPCGAAK